MRFQRGPPPRMLGTDRQPFQHFSSSSPTGVVYGLINVRTDGKRILCAALNEKDRTWNIAVVKPKPRGA